MTDLPTLRLAIEAIEARRRAQDISVRRASREMGKSASWWARVAKGELTPDHMDLIRMSRAVDVEATVRAITNRPAPVPNMDDTGEAFIWQSDQLGERDRLDMIEELRDARAGQAPRQSKAGGNR